MKITKQTTLAEIKKEFAGQFEGLKLEFFKKPLADGLGSPKKDILESTLKVGDVNSAVLDTAEMKWSKSSTASEVEQEFEHKLGLHVQVFRLTGRVWIETTTTDSYTLEKQMSKSLESQTPI